MNPRYAQRFTFALAILAGVAVAGVVISIVLAVKGSSTNSSGPWSSWAPQDSGPQGAREIADHIAPLYRISGVDQLAVVTVSNLGNASAATSSASSAASSQSSPGGPLVAVRPSANSSSISLISGSTVAYNLCGLGSSNCSIGIGTPSTDRLLLLRREALELALYTFKYLPQTQNVVAILPPGHQATTSSLTAKPPSASPSAKPLDMALLFQHQELSPFLSQPLDQTFTQQFPPTVPQIPLWKQTTEAALVEQITARGIFSEHTTTAQDGTNLIVLDPLPPS
ncbi:MAG TPA: hypothetical protein VLP43_09555 [Solirubrobacteraceae bacterium]|nr:hypothetical protein [Solirubrobacteraceae bacterium]